MIICAVRLVKLRQTGNGVLHGRIGRKIKNQRFHLGPQEVVRAAGAKLGQPRMLTTRKEVEYPLVVGEVPNHRLVE
jgi:hypothetical protein